jgi:hypothetical protein
MRRRSSVAHAAVALLAVVWSYGCHRVQRPRTDSLAPVAEFLVSVTPTDSGLRLTCTRGCAWTELAFSPAAAPINIDALGMANREHERRPVVVGLTPFLFSIYRSTSGVYLQGRSGTAWTILSFSCSKTCTQSIDQYGMRR